MPQSRIFNVANMSFNVIGKNKILVKISKITVVLLGWFIIYTFISFFQEQSSGPYSLMQM